MCNIVFLINELSRGDNFFKENMKTYHLGEHIKYAHI